MKKIIWILGFLLLASTAHADLFFSQQVNSSLPSNGTFTNLTVTNQLITSTETVRAFLTFSTSTVIPSSAASNVSLYAVTTQGFTRLVRKDEGTTDVTIGRDNVLIVFNNSGALMPKLSLVYCEGNQGVIPAVNFAQANSIGTLPAIGMVLDDIPANSY